MPKIDLIEIEDFYFYYVIMNGISEDLFWDEEINFVKTVLEEKIAYENYMAYMNEKER